MKTASYPTQENKSQFLALFSGVMVAYAITCIIFIGYAILITYSSVTEAHIPLVVTVTSLLSVIVAGFDASRGATKLGWLWGILAGLMYVIILIAIGYFINRAFTFDSRTVVLIVLALSGGGLGGVIGINFKK